MKNFLSSFFKKEDKQIVEETIEYPYKIQEIVEEVVEVTSKRYKVHIPIYFINTGDVVFLLDIFPNMNEVTRIYDNGIFVKYGSKSDKFIPNKQLVEHFTIAERDVELRLGMKVVPLAKTDDYFREEYTIIGFEDDNCVIIENGLRRIVINTLDKDYVVLGVNDFQGEKPVFRDLDLTDGKQAFVAQFLSELNKVTSKKPIKRERVD